MISETKSGRSKLARRAFLIGGVAVGGGLLVGAGIAARLAHVGSYKLPAKDGEFSFGAWLRIARDGRIEVAVPNHEMGQGIHSLARLLAAEGLRVPLESVHAVQAPIAAYYSNPAMMTDMLPWDEHKEGGWTGAAVWTADKIIRAVGVSATGGSASTRTIAEPIRACAASALDMLMRAAAQSFGVPVEQVTVSGGSVSGAGKSATYGDLADAASRLSPGAVKLPPLAPGMHVGRDVPRADAEPKTKGTEKYGIDVRENGQLYAAICHSPRLGGVLKSVAALDGLTGVQGFVEGKNKDFIAIVASSYYHAASALQKVKDQCKIVWDDSRALDVSTEDVFAAYRSALKKGGDYSPRKVIDAQGDPEKSADGEPVRETYRVPFLAHATMEPVNATALVSDNGVKVWARHQSSFLVQWFAARAAKVSCSAVTVETQPLGGGFGRRADLGYIAKAVEIATRFRGKPVQTIWSREEDIRDDVYRPAAMADVSAVLSKESGLPVNFIYRVAAPSVLGQFAGRILPIASCAVLKDRSTVDGAIFSFYGLPNRSIEYLTVDLGIPVGFWRSVGYSFNTFFLETFVDKMAATAGATPIEYRERLIKAAQGTEASRRAAGILEKLKSFDAQNSLAPPKKEGRKVGRGISLSECFRSFVGQLADVEVDEKANEIHVNRVHAVVDCGFAIDPANVRRSAAPSISVCRQRSTARSITTTAGSSQKTSTTIKF